MTVRHKLEPRRRRVTGSRHGLGRLEDGSVARPRPRRGGEGRAYNHEGVWRGRKKSRGYVQCIRRGRRLGEKFFHRTFASEAILTRVGALPDTPKIPKVAIIDTDGLTTLTQNHQQQASKEYKLRKVKIIVRLNDFFREQGSQPVFHCSPK